MSTQVTLSLDERRKWHFWQPSSQKVAEWLSAEELCSIFSFLPVEVVLHVKQFLPMDYKLIKRHRCKGPSFTVHVREVVAVKHAKSLQRVYLDFLLFRALMNCSCGVEDMYGQPLRDLGRKRLKNDWFQLYPPWVSLHAAALEFGGDYPPIHVLLYHARRCRNRCWHCQQHQLNFSKQRPYFLTWWVRSVAYTQSVARDLLGSPEPAGVNLVEQLSACLPQHETWKPSVGCDFGVHSHFTTNVRQSKRKQNRKAVWMPVSMI